MQTNYIDIGVVVEKRAVDHPWGQEEWCVTGVLPGIPDAATPRLISNIPGQEGTRFLAAVMPLTLHSTETDAYIYNITSHQASLYVVLRERDEEASLLPFEVVLITVNPYEAEHYLGGDEANVYKLVMPQGVHDWVEEFIAHFHQDKPFKKRRRDKGPRDEYVFGQEPVAEMRARLGVMPGEKGDE